MDLLVEYIIPLIKVIFLGGFFGVISFFVGKGFHNAWTKEWKFIWKYNIRKKPYPEKTLLWCWDAVERGLGWYDVKKHLMIKNTKQNILNETLWIYDKIISDLNNEKGGIKHGRKHKRSYRKDEKQLPTL